MLNNGQDFQEAIDASLSDNLKMIVGGVAGLVMLALPIILIHAIKKRVEAGGDLALKTLENKLS